MAVDRMLRASMRDSEKVNGWPIPVRYFWTQLWGYCDDWGRGKYVAKLIKAGTFPLDDETTAKVVQQWMTALEDAEVIRIYDFDGKSYFECVNWPEHQGLSYRKKTDIPDIAGVIPTAGKHFEKVSELSGKFQKSFKEGEGEVDIEVEGEGMEMPPAAPSRFCKKHPNGTDENCRSCGTARVNYEASRDAFKTKPTVPGIITDPDCLTHPGRPARGCDRCAEEVAA